jgi:hypothetical protein
MPTKVLKTEEEVRDFVRGCAFFGTGGGGDPKIGLRFLLEDLREGKEIKWRDISEIPEDTVLATPFYMGSIAPLTEADKERMRKLGLDEEKEDRVLIEALRELEGYTGAKIGAITPFEIGGINTPGPVDAAVRMGLLMVDGDYSGRALPEISQGLPAILGKKGIPIATCDRWGNRTVIKEAVNYDVTEFIGKSISLIAFGLCGQAGMLLQMKEVKDAIIPGTLTRALEVGRAIRNARENNRDSVKAAAEACDGWVLFKGKVAKRETEDKEGYFWGTNTIEGIENFSGHTFKIWFKNENHVSWFDDKPYVASPDILAVLDLHTGEPITNSDLKKGEVVGVVGVKNEKFRTPEGISQLGPKHYGFDIEYKPIEELVK